MKITIAVKLAGAGALLVGSAFASTLGVASATCPGTSFTGFGGGAFASVTWQPCGPVTPAGSSVTADTTVSANNASLSTMNTFLSPQSVPTQGGITPVEGAAFKTQFTTSGGTLSFNYLAIADPAVATFAFMLLDGTQYDLGDHVPLAPAGVNAAIVTLPSFSTSVPAGPHNVAFGLMNGNSLLADPTLTISNLDAPASGIPEPVTLALIVVAWGLMSIRRGFRSRV